MKPQPAQLRGPRGYSLSTVTSDRHPRFGELDPTSDATDDRHRRATAAWAAPLPLPCGLPAPHGRGYARRGRRRRPALRPRRRDRAAAAAIAPGPLVGHCSGATTLDVLAPHEAFSLHPLMTVTARGRVVRRRAAAPSPARRRGRSGRSRARPLARACGPFEIADADRAAYHAAASIASNFLVTLESAAERVAATAGVERDAARAARARDGRELGRRGRRRAHRPDRPRRRGDGRPPARGVAERAPELLALFDALADATRELVAAA